MTKKTVEIVVHCYAEERPVFASLLTAQLSSLVIWPPSTCEVVVDVVGCNSDALTRGVVRVFQQQREAPQIVIRWRGMTKPEMFRRGYARNLFFKTTFADFIWATDCDYLFGEGCLDALAAMNFQDCIGYPEAYLIHKSHAAGDAEIARIVPGSPFVPDLSLYVPEFPKHAIGGLQIAPRDFARQGYLDGTKWSRPDDSATRFSYAEDRRYRSRTMKIPLPGVYRFRHSVTDYEPAEKRLASTADAD